MAKTPDEIKIRAERARLLLNDELLREMFDTIERDAFDQWKASALNSYDERTDLFYLVKGIEALKTRLQAVIDEGLLVSRNSL